ncbi:MAG TPA: alpha/beta hydrolase [Burkholderiaceae bacterium]|nr:alpha/beta hydrolase [Burkholderiaceae bacterium]
MPLHPVIAADLRAAAELTPYWRLPLAEARAAARVPYLRRKTAQVEVAAVRELAVPGEAGPIRVRLYTPFGAAPHPLVVFFHGSGFTVLDLDTHDDFCRRLCATSGSVVASVDYRLAPEHPYPAGPTDSLTATRWLAAHGRELGCLDGALALAGDSAGGCLAAATALSLRDAGDVQADALVLWYPVTDHPSSRWPSYTEFEQGFGLSAEGMAWFWQQYLGDATRAREDAASPLRASTLAGLPPLWLASAEHDVLRDEGEAFAQRARGDGVPVQLHRAVGMNHGFLKYAGVIDEATQWMTRAGTWLRATVGTTATTTR